MTIPIERQPTRPVTIGTVTIGKGHPIAVQSMCATKTSDIEATVRQIQELARSGAALVRIAVDNDREVDAVREIRQRVGSNLVVDLQENFPLARDLAPHVDKIRYNPGHLHHRRKGLSVRDKVAFLADVASEAGCAIRVGVNCGSVDPEVAARHPGDQVGAMVESALFHASLLEELGFTRFCVSLKDSDPAKVIQANERFSAERPDIPLHLGVTEAGLPPDGILKTRLAFEKLLARGIGDTIRVSLTLPNERKGEEVLAGHRILEDVAAGRFVSVPEFQNGSLNIISCPSCSRVENEKFVDLAERVRELTAYARDHAVTIAVMGCRVNGPGETDDADLGLWCGPTHVNLKRGPTVVGAFGYDEILSHLREELDKVIAAGAGAGSRRQAPGPRPQAPASSPEARRGAGD